MREGIKPEGIATTWSGTTDLRLDNLTTIGEGKWCIFRTIE
jgi:hypothetical protein